MRLSEHERRAIREAGLRHIGVAPRLFGSRLDDTKRGGDIDPLVACTLPLAEAARRRIDLLAELYQARGERKIDVVLDDGGDASAIVAHARREAEPL